jgi:RNA polymerase sigma factor (sigma-70 family)
LVERETADALQEALRQLSRRQQEILHLVFYQEMSVQEAAAVLGMPVGTARTHYERGKARLRRLLARGGVR